MAINPTETHARAVNNSSLEALIQGGAFDSFGHQRKALYESVSD